MKRFIINNLWVIWLSMTVSYFYHGNIFSWEWWVVMLPTIVFVSLIKSKGWEK